MRKIKFRHIFLSTLVAFIIAARFSVRIGEWYSTCLYPVISSAISWILSWNPVSLEEIAVLAFCLLLICILISGVRRRSGFKMTFFRVAELVLWMYVWFYFGWGCNYYRESLYSRMAVERLGYDDYVFKRFISDFADSLNVTFEKLPTDGTSCGFSLIEAQVKRSYGDIHKYSGLSAPRRWQHPKKLLFNELYSSVGVLGFIGPFFCETQINAELLPTQVPFVYAHEYSHLLGVSNEDEANFWAYTVCVNSDVPEIRYSGYFLLLPYVLSNADRVLSGEDYRDFIAGISPEILEQYSLQREYWNSKYSKWLGHLQSAVYDAFLKGNKVASGTASYLEVIDMIISLKANSCIMPFSESSI